MHMGGRNSAAHRLAYEFAKGPIPEGMDIDHVCRNRACCNPEHLTPVSHRENLERAGLVPPPVPFRIDTYADTHGSPVDTACAIDTAACGPQDNAGPYINDGSIPQPSSDTPAQVTPVSMQGESRFILGSEPNHDKFHVIARPQGSDPFAPLCVMSEPPELELAQHPTRNEHSFGTKADLGIDDWARTEFGPFWWKQTDEQLRQKTVHQQTELMREQGEFLHWYLVTPADPNAAKQRMSARTGPEACVKVERCFGKAWAISWEYICPDPHRGPFFDHRVLLRTGEVVTTVARTIPDAISMVHEIWGPRHVLTCDRLSRTTDGHLRAWAENRREYLDNQRQQLERRSQKRQGP
jgi:hypothetical protein